MKHFPFLFAFLQATAVSAKVVDLNSENWEKYVTTSGKNVFVKFYAPWCGHCKKLKPDWDALGELYDLDGKTFIGDVDCTADVSKDLCKKYDIKGFPTLKSFWRSSYEDYDGPRGLESLKKFAADLKPMCSANFLEHCTDAQKEEIKTLESMSAENLSSKIKEIELKLSTLEKDHKALLENLQGQFQKSNENLEAQKKSLNPQIAMMKEILEKKQSVPKEEL